MYTQSIYQVVQITASLLTQCKNTKNPEKQRSLKNRCLVPTMQTEPDFFWTCCFRKKLDNVELITYMKFQKILITACRYIGKKT